METKEQYEARISAKGKVIFGVTHVALPCYCDYIKGPHWATVINDEDYIKLHMELNVQELNGD